MLEFLISTYIVFIGVCFIGGVISVAMYFLSDAKTDKLSRKYAIIGARVALASPFWPLICFYLLIKTVAIKVDNRDLGI